MPTPQAGEVLIHMAAAPRRGATTAVYYNHFSLLRTIEYIFGLPTLASNDAAASLMTDWPR